ncbi:MAG: RNA polymerase sigma factor, partial [Acidimicrobiales bacterium]
LVMLYDSKVRAAIRSVEGFTSDEDDLAQEVFVRLLIRLRRPGSLRVGAWLWRVARNLAIDDLRRRHTRTEAGTALDRSRETSVESRHDDGLNQCLSEIFREMPERQRDALLTVAEHGGRRSGSCQAVATSLGVTTAAAEGLLARGRSRLASDLARSGFVFRPAAAIGFVRLALGRWSRHAAGLRRSHAIAMAIIGAAGVGAAVPLLVPAISSGTAPRPTPPAAYVRSASLEMSSGHRADHRLSDLSPARTGGRNQGGSTPGAGGPSAGSAAPVMPTLGVVETSARMLRGLIRSAPVLTAGAVASVIEVSTAGSGTADASGAPLVSVDQVGAGGASSASLGPLADDQAQVSQPLLMAVATAAPLSPTPSR